MAKCKHNRLPDRVRNGLLERSTDQYYCTQCQAWVPAGPVNQEADKRAKEDAEGFERYRNHERWN